MADRILRRPAVEHLTALSRTTIYDLMREGNFPMPVQLSSRAVGWLESEVVHWMKKRPTGTRS